jgi:hypothetical protein
VDASQSRGVVADDRGTLTFRFGALGTFGPAAEQPHCHTLRSDRGKQQQQDNNTLRTNPLSWYGYCWRYETTSTRWPTTAIRPCWRTTTTAARQIGTQTCSQEQSGTRSSRTSKNQEQVEKPLAHRPHSASNNTSQRWWQLSFVIQQQCLCCTEQGLSLLFFPASLFRRCLFSVWEEKRVNRPLPHPFLS